MVPGRVVSIEPGRGTATIDLRGAAMQVNLVLLADDLPEVGDWVAVHMGFATERLSPSDAAEALSALVTIGLGRDAPEEATLLREWGLTPSDESTPSSARP